MTVSDNEETVGTESHFVENNLGIKTLLCLTTSDDREGNPVSKTESLRRHLPIRVFGRIIYIDENLTKFSISLINDPRNETEFKYLINQFYTDPAQRLEADEDSREVGGLYVCRVGQEFFRCRLTKLFKMNCEVYLMDVGAYKEVKFNDLFSIGYQFYGQENLNYAFALQCCVPEIETSLNMGLPTLAEFSVNEVVDVVICSLHEPCLAIIGSNRKHYSRIYPESLTDGLDEVSIPIWQSNFLSPMPSFNGITTGQYPSAQPNISDSCILATVAGFNSLACVHLRDITCSIRLSVLQEILNDFYVDDKCRAQMFFAEATPLTQDLPCVVFDPMSVQYFRAKVVRLSGDRTLADVTCVDYPSITFRSVERSQLYMLSEKFFLPPQCFSVQLVDDDGSLNIHDYTLTARHFVEVGSVVSVHQSPKSTVAVMKSAAGDILERIGLKKTEDKELEKVAPFPKYKVSPTRHFSSSTASINFRPVSVKPKFPVGSVQALVATIRNADEIYYRKSHEAAAYEKVVAHLNNMDKSSMVVFNEEDLKKVKVNRMFIAAAAPSFEFHRVRIVKNDLHANGELIYKRVDDGEQASFYKGHDKLYDITYDIERLPPAIVGPCRLVRPDDIPSTPELGAYLKDVRLVSKLRLFFIKSRSCMIHEKKRIGTPKSMQNGSPSGAGSNPELLIFSMDGMNINKAYFAAVAEFIQKDKVEKSWQIPMTK